MRPNQSASTVTPAYSRLLGDLKTLPIGIATYGLISRFPDAYRKLLPSEDEMVARLAGWTQEE